MAAVAAVALTQGAGHASADITDTRVACLHGEAFDPCSQTVITVDTSDTNPVWITLNGTALAGSPFTPVHPFTPPSGGATVYAIQVSLDCIYTPLHVVVAQKDAAGTVTSQMSANYDPATSPGFTGSSQGGSARFAGSATGCHVISVIS
ncbi:hypothetical protein KHQ06_00420 [Nocardia tengchongensis]|uniref:Uncharacterized protein n=1 Tax=Nocardia tengchongensis TaxID=2055889 RepID=A0ABX8CP41_9NOCA|nr:hypothetical protein [Nocardia tengchongensis]QVI21697.1 hypothetical protein KHQ06_00420 [Nocardia tengchongensis]